VTSGRTVREAWADCPLVQGRPSENEPRTSNISPSKFGPFVGTPRTVHEKSTPRRLSVDLTWTVRQTLRHRKLLENEKETLKNTRRTRRTPSRPAPRGLSAASRQTVRDARIEQPEPENANMSSHIHPWISQTA
jgi:hypothetical protein